MSCAGGDSLRSNTRSGPRVRIPEGGRKNPDRIIRENARFNSASVIRGPSFQPRERGWKVWRSGSQDWNPDPRIRESRLRLRPLEDAQGVLGVVLHVRVGGLR